MINPMSGMKKRVLVVEDNNETQLIVKVALRNVYDLDITDSAEGAISLLKTKPYDLALLDINLNGEGDGKMILNEIRNKLNNKTLPVIVTTAYELSEEDKTFIEKNSNAFIAKPFDQKNILNTIEQILGK
jgi:CheY-like chemotaxis protein